ncbi:MAG: ABC transporter permease [Thermoguttaceae bacterium]
MNANNLFSDISTTCFFSFLNWNTLPSWVKALRWIDLGALVIVILFVIAVFAFRAIFPKIGAIAWVTAKEAIMQPLFMILTSLGLFALFIFLFIPYNTLGEDIVLVITQGLTLIKLFAVFLAIWTASSSIADEIEGKTALMILAKPVGRRSFIIGKYVGVMIAVSILFLILAIFFTNTISYKVVYDARESAKEIPTAIECLQKIVSILPGLVLAYLETMILAAVAVAISTRFSLLPNLTISFTIYILGHLVPQIVQSSVGQLPMVAFIGELSCAVLPVLDHFSMESAIAMNRSLPWSYVGVAAAYSVIYCLMALALSLLLFEDRDLA